VVSLKMIESPVIFTTYPLNTGSFSRRKYALSMALTTTAIMPASAFTTPLRLIWSIARQRLPMLHPEPIMLRLTTGLRNGSRRPVRLITLGSCFLATSGVLLSLTATFCLGRANAATALVLGATALLAFLGALVAMAG